MCTRGSNERIKTEKKTLTNGPSRYNQKKRCVCVCVVFGGGEEAAGNTAIKHAHIHMHAYISFSCLCVCVSVRLCQACKIARASERGREESITLRNTIGYRHLKRKLSISSYLSYLSYLYICMSLPPFLYMSIYVSLSICIYPRICICVSLFLLVCVIPVLSSILKKNQ